MNILAIIIALFFLRLILEFIGPAAQLITLTFCDNKQTAKNTGSIATFIWCVLCFGIAVTLL